MQCDMRCNFVIPPRRPGGRGRRGKLPICSAGKFLVLLVAVKIVFVVSWWDGGGAGDVQ